MNDLYRGLVRALLAIFFLSPLAARVAAAEASPATAKETAALRYFRAVMADDGKAMAALPRTDAMKKAPLARVRGAFTTTFGRPGACRRIATQGDGGAVFLFIDGEKQNARVTVTFQGDSIAGLFFAPVAEAAPMEEGAEAVTLATPTGDLAGVLNAPAADAFGEARPVVLLIAGSGPTDRDGNQPPHINTNGYRLLAAALAERGIATLRYDKRGLGASGKAGADESLLRFDHYVDDAARWIAWLAERGFAPVVVAGHSEGALVGMLAVSRGGAAAGYISLAGAGRPIDQVMKGQLEDLPEPVKGELFAVLDAMREGRPVDPVPQGFESIARVSVQPYMTSWMAYDPAAELAKAAVPVLLVQGGTDVQINRADFDRLAAAQPDAATLVIDDMNHVLKVCATTDQEAQQATYTRPDTPLSEALVEAVAEFVRARVADDAPAAP